MLAESAHRPQLILTPPDRPRGRGRRLASPPVADAARALGIELRQTATVSDAAAIRAIEAASPDAFGVCQFGQLIKEPLLSLKPMLNVHPSMLPRWRGAAPIERALMAGDDETGTTIFQIVAELDAGPIALRQPEPITAGETYSTLAPRLAKLGAEMLVSVFDRLAADALELVDQPASGVTYAEKIDPSERRLDPTRPSLELDRAVRALNPHVGTYVELRGGERLGVSRAALPGTEAPAGELLVDGDRLLLGCKQSTLELLEVKPPGKRAMTTADFLRGTKEPPRLA